MNDYPIIVVPQGAYDAEEPVGTKFKFWFAHSKFGECLFKEGRPGTGENWSEKIASELADLLLLPHASYELAQWTDHRGDKRDGVITPTLVANARLVLGNEILARVEHAYEPHLRYSQRRHTVRLVSALMRALREPTGFAMDGLEPGVCALDAFVGYLMFDAWIGNTDRHDQNWALINHSKYGITLAPSFDHASSLGRELTDEVRAERLNTSDSRFDVAAYARKGRSGLYSKMTDSRSLLTDEAFLEMSKLARPAASKWLGRLSGVKDNDVRSIFDRVPDHIMSTISKEFSLQLLAVNRGRLLDR